MFPIDYIKKLVEEDKTFYLYSKRIIETRSKILLSVFKNTFEDFNNYFAVKATPNPKILQIMLDLGMGLDCSSTAELEIAKRLGVSGDKIIFTSNYTSKDDLLLARKMNVMINLDDKSLVKDLKDVCEKNSLSFPEYLFFRVNPGIGTTNSETKSNVLGGPNAKFGIEPKDIKNTIEEAKSYGLKDYGIHVMTGSNVLNEKYFYELTKTVVEIIKENSLNPTMLNLGGGLGIPYTEDKKELNLGKVVDGIKDGLGDMKVKVIMENGRYLTGPAGFLFTQVQVIKESFGKKYLGVHACMSNLMRPGMYNAYHNIINFSKAELEDEDETYQIVGNLCENNDWFGRDRVLPKSEVGDIIVICDSGAHSHSMGFQYNGKLRSSEYLMDENGISKIRRKETIDDYLLTLI